MDKPLPAGTLQETKAMLLEAQARWGLHQAAQAWALAHEVLRRDPSHGRAADLVAAMEDARHKEE